MGLFNAIALLPVVLIMHTTGYESLHELTPSIFFLIVAKGLLDNVLSDLLWARAIILTSPTIATVGTCVCVPFSHTQYPARSSASRQGRLLWPGST